MLGSGREKAGAQCRGCVGKICFQEDPMGERVGSPQPVSISLCRYHPSGCCFQKEALGSHSLPRCNYRVPCAQILFAVPVFHRESFVQGLGAGNRVGETRVEWGAWGGGHHEGCFTCLFPPAMLTGSFGVLHTREVPCMQQLEGWLPPLSVRASQQAAISHCTEGIPARPVGPCPGGQ